MVVKHLVLIVMALVGLMTSAIQSVALGLGELQAVPGNYPPYVFRLSILSASQDPFDIPTVTVRQPRDVLSLVTNHLLELHLPTLTDVELEMHQGGETLNRLLLKRELQAARARLETVNPAVRHQPLLSRDRQSPGAEAKSLPSAAAPTPDRALLEHEMQEIRQAIRTLVGRVSPWEGQSKPLGPDEKPAIRPAFTLTPWAGVGIGLVALLIGYLVRPKAVDHQQRQMLEASIRHLQGQLTSGELARLPSRPAQLSGYQPRGLGPVTVKRHVRVSQKTRRRIRVRASRRGPEAAPAGLAGHAQLIARLSQTGRLAPAEIVEALGHLRQELSELQRRLPHASHAENSHIGSPQARG
jgi:hypothetical protein